MLHRLIALAGLFFLTTFASGQPAARLPSKVDLVSEFKKFDLAPEAQGDRDVCSLFAITSLADFETARHGGTEVHQRLSPEFLIWAARKSTGHKGEQAMFYEAIHGLNTLGVCKENLMGFAGKANLTGQPSKAALADAKERSERWRAHWIKRWDLKRQLTDAEFHAIKETLAAGHPVACGLRWPKTLKGYTLLEVPPTGQVFDGHSIAFVGYEDDPKKPGGGTFRFRNSWGPDWGQDGYGLMSYAYARAYANDAVWLEIEEPHAETPLHRFEAETIPVVAKAKCETSSQDMNPFGGLMWSHGKQLFCNAKDGAFLELALEVGKAGRYRVRVLATAGPDFGEIRIALDGKHQSPDFDLYCGRVSPAGSLEVGTHELTAGRHVIRIQVVGKNVGSANFYFGIDAVDLLTAN